MVSSHHFMGFPGGSVVKESACQRKRHRFVSWVGKILWRRKRQATPVFLPGKSHGQRGLVGSSPRGRTRVRHDLATKQQEEATTLWPLLDPTVCSVSSTQPKQALEKKAGEVPKHDGQSFWLVCWSLKIKLGLQSSMSLKTLAKKKSIQIIWNLPSLYTQHYVLASPPFILSVPLYCLPWNSKWTTFSSRSFPGKQPIPT